MLTTANIVSKNANIVDIFMKPQGLLLLMFIEEDNCHDCYNAPCGRMFACLFCFFHFLNSHSMWLSLKFISPLSSFSLS